MVDAKSSQNGVDKALDALGDPRSRFGRLVSTNPQTRAFTEALQEAIDAGYQVKGLTVKVGVPIPGTSGISKGKVLPWVK